MATIIRREHKDYGGEEIWVAEDPTPIYAAPHVTVTNKWLDDVILVRQAGHAESKVDAMYSGWAGKATAQVDKKMQKEKAALGSVDYAKKTAAQVEADVKSISDPWADTSGVSG